MKLQTKTDNSSFLSNLRHMLKMLFSSAFKTNNNSIVLLLIILIWSVSFLPLITHGGFIADDWLMLEQARLFNSFTDYYLSWFPLMTYRPLAPLFYSILPFYFNSTSPTVFVLVNTVLYCSSIYMFSTIIRMAYNTTAQFIFLLLAGSPVICSMWLFMPVSFISNNIAIFVFSAGGYLLYKYNFNSRMLYFIASIILLFVSFLIYEMQLFLIPLLWLSIYFKKYSFTASRSNILQFSRRNILPIVGISTVVIIYQKLISTHVFGGLSSTRISFSHMVNLKQIVFYALDFTQLIFLKIPILLISVFKHADFSANLFIVIILILCLLIIIFAKLKSEKILLQKSFVFLIVFALFLCVFVFVITGYGIHCGTIENRFLFPAWICICFILSLIAFKNSFFKFIAFSIVLLSAISFHVQIKKQIEAYKTSFEIAQDFAGKMDNNDRQIILAYVPSILADNYNMEPVFGGKLYDLPCAINSINDTVYNSRIIKYDYKRINRYLTFPDSTVNIYEILFSKDNLNVVSYIYNPHDKRSEIKSISTLTELKTWRDSIISNGINYPVYPLHYQYGSISKLVKFCFK